MGCGDDVTLEVSLATSETQTIDYPLLPPTCVKQLFVSLPDSLPKVRAQPSLSLSPNKTATGQSSSLGSGRETRMWLPVGNSNRDLRVDSLAHIDRVLQVGNDRGSLSVCGSKGDLGESGKRIAIGLSPDRSADQIAIGNQTADGMPSGNQTAVRSSTRLCQSGNQTTVRSSHSGNQTAVRSSTGSCQSGNQTAVRSSHSGNQTAVRSSTVDGNPEGVLPTAIIGSLPSNRNAPMPIPLLTPEIGWETREWVPVRQTVVVPHVKPERSSAIMVGVSNGTQTVTGLPQGSSGSHTTVGLPQVDGNPQGVLSTATIGSLPSPRKVPILMGYDSIESGSSPRTAASTVYPVKRELVVTDPAMEYIQSRATVRYNVESSPVCLVRKTGFCLPCRKVIGEGSPVIPTFSILVRWDDGVLEVRTVHPSTSCLVVKQEGAQYLVFPLSGDLGPPLRIHKNGELHSPYSESSGGGSLSVLAVGFTTAHGEQTIMVKAAYARSLAMTATLVTQLVLSGKAMWEDLQQLLSCPEDNREVLHVAHCYTVFHVSPVMMESLKRWLYHPIVCVLGRTVCLGMVTSWGPAMMVNPMQHGSTSSRVRDRPCSYRGYSQTTARGGNTASSAVMRISLLIEILIQ